MFQYQPPAAIDDLDGRPTRTKFLAAWHDALRQQFEDEIKNLPDSNKFFFSESTIPATSIDQPVPWNAFPLYISRVFPDAGPDRWKAADQLGGRERGVNGQSVVMPFRYQDEYCEWHAYTDGPDGPIKRIVFTAEAPEYWVELARHDFDRVVALYREWVSPDVQPEDLKLEQDIEFNGYILGAGTYNPYNTWNTEHGCMHLTHPANTLGAEINLAARATIPRKDKNGDRVTEVRRLACSSNFGDVDRSSDPSIGQGVNLTVWPGATGAKARSITLSNPVGLYIDHIDPDTITDDKGNPRPDWFRIVRGTEGRGLLAVFEAPPGATIGMDKIRVEGRAVNYGGQLAEQIQMVLYAKTADLGLPNPVMRPATHHCCMQDNGKPPEKQNLDHPAIKYDCAGAAAKEAFAELKDGAQQGAGPAPVEEQLPTSSPSRLGRPMEKWHG